MLRQEVYAEDGSAEAALPYVVTQQTHGVRAIQPTRDAPYAVFLPLGAETLTIHYERKTTAPRMSHELVLQTDALGYVTRSATIAYGHPGGADYSEQQTPWVQVTEQSYPSETDDPSWYRHGVPYETASW